MCGQTLQRGVSVHTQMSDMGSMSTPCDPCVISTATQLQSIERDLDGHFALGSNYGNIHDAKRINLLVAGNTNIGGIVGANWNAISKSNVQDSQLKGDRGQASRIGDLVGWNKSIIENSEVADPVVKEGDAVGGFAGRNGPSTLG